MTDPLLPKNKSFDDSGAQFVWDSTSLKLAEECPRKYQYKMIDGWQSRLLSVHLRFGAHYATALEHFYKHVALGDSVDEALEKVVLEALSDTWDRPEISFEEAREELVGYGSMTSKFMPDGTVKYYSLVGAPWTSPDPLKTRENLIRTIIWYVAQFENEAITVIKQSDGRPAVEYSFTLAVDDGYFFAGHLDRMVDYAHNVYVMDQKTTKSTISSRYFDGFNPDVQMSMYTFAGKAIYHLPVKGVIIDAAQIAVGFSRFERGFTFRTEGQLNEWYDEMLALIERTRKMTANAHFPMNRSACGNYGGCEFRGVCSRDPAVRKQFLAADFDVGATWDPMNKR